MRKQLWTVALMLVALLAWPSGDAAAKRGTIFIVEGQAGYTLGSVFSEAPDGLGARLTLGVGGKFRGWPTRFYGIFNVTSASLSGTHGSGIDRAETTRSWFAWSAGLRMLSPIARNVRFLTDLSIGRAMVDSEATVLVGNERYRLEDDGLLVEIGIGLQYRVSLGLSLGARVDVAIPTNLDSFDLLGELAGAPSSDGGLMNPSFLLTATLHL
ncbi:MAG: hypothetical protein EP329_12175 [Deltaproteobacteria bacterium]|nr:MAG: hypothetical protein EP329_12175 [Deltaproteobacteria bacterium]